MNGSAASEAPVDAVATAVPILQIEDLRVEFRSLRGVVKALNGVNLTVHQGEIVGLVGESGCGKTVTGFSVLGLLPQPQAQITSGRILFQGSDLLQKPPKEMRTLKGKAISMVFQDPLASLNPVFTVGEQISRVIRVHQAREEEAGTRGGAHGAHGHRSAGHRRHAQVVSTPAQRRHAPARLHGHGHLLRLSAAGGR